MASIRALFAARAERAPRLSAPGARLRAPLAVPRPTQRPSTPRRAPGSRRRRSYSPPDRVLLRRGRRAPPDAAAPPCRCRGRRRRQPDAARTPRDRLRRVRASSCWRWSSWSRAAAPRPRRTRSRTTTARSPRSATSPPARSVPSSSGCLGQGGDESPQDLQTAVSGFRVQAEQQLKQARGLDVPTRCGCPAVAARRAGVAPRRPRLHRPAHPHRARRLRGGRRCGDPADSRADAGLPRLRRRLPHARRAVDRAALKKEEIGGQQIPQSRFLPDIRWLERDDRRQAARPAAPAGAAAKSNEPPRPGLHGTSGDSVSSAT